MKKIAIIEEIDKEGLKLFDNNSNFKYEIITDTSEENLIKVLPNFDGCSLRISKLTSKIMSACKNLKIISRHGVGYDNIDLKKAKEKDIKIAITANANAVTVAEHVMFVLLHIAKRKNLFDKTVRDGNFKDRNKLPKTIEIWKKIF